MTEATRLDLGPGGRLAYRARAGTGPTVLFVGGFMSDMAGTKASFLDDWAATRGQSFLRYDHFGHGESDGPFEDGTIGRWADDLVTVIDRLTRGDLVLVGSSMGGWLALLAALRRPDRVKALIGIAAAPDFTEDLIWATAPTDLRAGLLAAGVVRAPSDYGGEYIITRALIEDGRQHLLLRGPIAITCPVRLIHGRRDPDVPFRTAGDIAERISGGDARVIAIDDGDHRLSRPEDLALLGEIIAAMIEA